MTFLPKRDLLTLEELDRLCSAFVARGVRKLRITGGEPLVRKNIMWLFARSARHLDSGALEELTLTTNGSQLAKYAADLKACGVRRINVSLDTLDREEVQGHHPLGRSCRRCWRASRRRSAAGLKRQDQRGRLKGINEDEIDDLIRFAHGRGYDLTLIETMPLGEIDGDRTDQYLPLSIVRARLMDRWTLDDIPYRTGGPARYVRVEETGGRLGFITPLTHNFCESCNRVRLTCTGTLYMCLGQEDAVDLRAPLRASGGRRASSRGHRRGHRAEAQGPRFRHRSPSQAAGAAAPHERHRRLKVFDAEGRDRWRKGRSRRSAAIRAADAPPAHRLRARLRRDQRHHHRLRRRLARADLRNLAEPPQVGRDHRPSHLRAAHARRHGRLLHAPQCGARRDPYRKRAYDEAYVDWNKNILLNLFAIREVAGDLKISSLEPIFEDELVAAMADVDRCLTKAYDRRSPDEDARPLLDACRMSEVHQFVLDCGATFTDELYKLTQLSFSPFGNERKNMRAAAEANIRDNCVRQEPAATTGSEAARQPRRPPRSSTTPPAAASADRSSRTMPALRRAACARWRAPARA